MANSVFSFGRYGRNVAKSCGIATNATTFFLLKKFLFTDYHLTRYFAALPLIDTDDSVKTSNYALLTEGQNESRKIVVSHKLVELFQIEYKEAARIIDSYPALAKIGSANVTKTALAAESVGILKSVLLKYPWILSVPSGDLKYGVKLIKKFHGKINETAPLLVIPMYKLTYYTSFIIADRKVIPQKSRIAYFSENLECDCLTISEAFSRHPYLFVLPFPRVHSIMTLLLDANIQKNDILNDLWIFRHCQKTIMKRIEVTKQAGIIRVKPWMLRCSDATLSITLNRHLKSKLLLGSHQSVTSYIRERLNCSEEEIECIIRKHPVIGKTNVAKLNTIIDYLYAEGYDNTHILMAPRVLAHSFKTLRTRIEELNMLGYNGKSLSKLCLSQEKFKDFISRLKE